MMKTLVGLVDGHDRVRLNSGSTLMPIWSEQVSGRRKAAAGVILVLLSACFNFVLCFLNTQHLIGVTPSMVVAAEAALLACGMLVVWKNVDATLLQSSLLVVAVVVALALLNPMLDTKILFDLAIVPVFFLLGRVSTKQTANNVVLALLVLTSVIGLAEIASPKIYESWFNIWQFYIAKGSVDPLAANYTSGNFFPSGVRVGDDGRGLLPFLFSSHRASSIFLEPVSMGNFPVICLAWLLAVPSGSTAVRRTMFGLTLLCIVLPDSRFAAIACVVALGFSCTGLHKSALVAAVLPTFVLISLFLLGTFTLMPDEVPQLRVDDFVGRIVQSGKLLAFWTVRDWLALAPSPVSVLDTGYAYLINGASLPVVLFMAVCLALARMPTPESKAMRGLVVLYMTLDLCIGQSFFSIKTAALLWYLFGASGSMDRRSTSIGIEPDFVAVTHHAGSM